MKKHIHNPPIVEIVLLALHCAVIFYLSSKPAGDYPKVDFPQSDKIAHIIMYFPLGFLAARIACWYHKPYYLALVFCLAYGLSDELHQHFVPSRSSSVSDIIADGVGGLLGIIFFDKLFQLIKRKHPLSFRKPLGGI